MDSNVITQSPFPTNLRLEIVNLGDSGRYAVNVYDSKDTFISCAVESGLLLAIATAFTKGLIY